MSLLIEQNLVDGVFVSAKDGKTIAVINPATMGIIGHVPDMSAAEVETAIEAAHAAQKEWAAMTAYDRAAILLKWADLIKQNLEELAQIMTAENGKPIAESRTEVIPGNIQWYAESIKQLYGRIVPSNKKNREIKVIKQPIGVAGLITPWNFPNAMITRKAGAALAAGCAVVLKPDHRTPFSALALGKLALEAGMPKGVFNIVTGDAAAIGKLFCEHPKVKKLSFTGSTAVGKLLLQQTAPYLKKVSLELGGNAPFIIFDSVPIDEAITNLFEGKIRNSGQTCVSPNRVYVQDTMHDAFVTALTEAMKKLKQGDGRNDDVRVGPLIDEKAVAKVDGLVQDAIKNGAKCLLGGKKSDLGPLFYEPTLLVNVDPKMRLSCEEIFGPVIAIQKFTTEEEVLQRANDSEFGLVSYVLTHDLGQAHRLSQGLESGMVGVNTGMISFPAAPFGGMKYSGQGRESGIEGIDAFMETKMITMQM